MFANFVVNLQTFYCKSLVGFLGHCFRHPAHPVTKLLSLPLAERLASLRQRNPRVPSGLAQSARELMISVGVQIGELVAGRPGVRGHAGYVFRWGEGFFEEFRDGGPGWHFQKNDKSAIDLRVRMLLDLFRRRRNSTLPALMDFRQYALSDVQGEDSASIGVG